MLQNLGYNINNTVSQFLHGFHNQVQVEYFRYKGETNNFGTIAVSYHPPIQITVQQQVPEPATLMNVRKEVDIRYVRQFWANWEIMPAQRIDGKGGDLIWYDGHTWYIESIKDDFRQTGWVSVLGVMTFEPRPA